MNALAQLADRLFPPAPHVAMDDDAGGLAAIADPGVNLAIWQRRLSPALATDVNRLMGAAQGDVRLNAPLAGLASGLAAAFAEANLPEVPTLVADIVDLAKQAAPLMMAAAFDMRLEIVTGNACHKFHADYVPLLKRAYQLWDEVEQATGERKAGTFKKQFHFGISFSVKSLVIAKV